MIRIKATDVKGKLSVRQKYLLGRIPGRYALNGFHAPPEPREVRQARKLVNHYERVLSRKRCAADKRLEALLRKAREAVYFGTEEKALAIVKQIEKLLKTCQE